MRLLDCLATHQFRELFVDVLGWENARGDHALVADDFPFRASLIAHKRGLQVLHCPADRLTLSNRARLRAVQQKVAALAHEHILIYSTEEPRKQVWQWSIRKPDGGRLRHREHPFFSHAPPPLFLGRLEGLKFRQDEESAVLAADALARVRKALDNVAELKLFAGRPWHSVQSDRLWKAMKAGGAAELHDFLMFHHPLALWAARRFHQRYGIELEDAEQVCVIGLMSAARRFDPSRGFLFSTYAVHAMRRKLQRYRSQEFCIRVPREAWQPGYEIRQTIERVLTSGGTGAARETLANLEVTLGSRLKSWRGFEQAQSEISIDSERRAYREANQRQEHFPPPTHNMELEEWRAQIGKLLDWLLPKDALCLCLYLGWTKPPMTLEEIGNVLGVTRERVRQRIARAINRLRNILESEQTIYFADNASA